MKLLHSYYTKVPKRVSFNHMKVEKSQPLKAVEPDGKSLSFSALGRAPREEAHGACAVGGHSACISKQVTPNDVPGL